MVVISFIFSISISVTGLVICEANLAKLQVHANNFEALRSGGVQERFLSQHIITDTKRVVRGIPRQVRRIDTTNRIFRHYTTPKAAEAIRRSRKLIAGPRTIMTGGEVFYEDLSGVQFTNIEVTPQMVLEPDEAPRVVAIDFRLNGNVPVYQVNQHMFLVPGPRKYPEWIVRAYQDYIERGRFPKSTDPVEVFYQLDEMGGIPEPVEVPIEIVEN